MRIWIPGGRGMLGSAVVRALATLPHDVVVTGHDLDVGDAAAVTTFVQAHRPTHIINCAAFTRVDACETELDAATRANADGPGILGRAARDADARVLHVSTDYVFDGTATTPYAESAPTAPMSAYGRTKRAGEEQLMVATAGESIVMRTSWLFGLGGKNFVETIAGLMSAREELRVVADQVGRPTSTEDLAAAIVAVLGLDGTAPAPAGIYHFANTGETTWHAFTCAIRDELARRGAPLKVRAIHAIATPDYPTPARRPAWSVLSTAKIEAVLGKRPRAWPVALSDYVSAMLPVLEDSSAQE